LPIADAGREDLLAQGGLQSGVGPWLLNDLVRNMVKTTAREDLSALAQEFSQLVQVRTKFFMANLAQDRMAMLARAPRVLEIVDLENAADAFSEFNS
jgi:hypothetical protein